MITIDFSTSRLISTQVIAMRWVDMDAYQHMNNARYFDYMAEARTTYFTAAMHDPTTKYVLVHVACDFKKPLVYPKNILIKQYFSAMTHTTFTFNHTFHDPSDEEVLFAIGESVIVSIDAHTLRPIPVPASIKAMLLVP